MSTVQISQNTVYLPNILLDESNYPTWLFRLQTFLRGQNLYAFVDGSSVCPPQCVFASDGTTSVLNPEYETWKTQDQNVINLLSQTLSSKAMSCVVGSQSACEMWSRLRLKFAAPNRQNILQLKSNLQNLKKGSDNVETYLDKIKDARDALETVGVILDDEDVVVTVLRGLPSEFAAIKTVIRAQFVSCSMGELKTLLQAAEIDIETESQIASGLPLTAMVAHHHTSPTQSSASPIPVSTVTTSGSSQTNSPSIPPGFNHIGSSSSTSYIPIPAMPYGFAPYSPFPVFDPNYESPFSMAGFYGGRGSGHVNSGNGRASGSNGRGSFSSNGTYNSGSHNGASGLGSISGHPNVGFNNGGGFSNRANGNGNGGNTFTCQLCGKVGHGAKTCRTLSNFNVNNASSPSVECQYCGRPYHTADRCFHLIGFPNQRSNNEASTSSAMLARNVSNPPQFWLADSGATNHMTSEVQLLNNVAPYQSSDSVQVGNGQGVGQDPLQRTE